MNKKFLSAALFGALMVTSAGTFVSCDDNDDDIKDLQAQLDKKASIEDLQAKVSQLQASIDAAKADAAAAKAKAEEALSKGTQGGASQAELDALKADLQKQIDKLASLDDVTKQVAALKAELSKDFITVEKLQSEVEKVTVKVMALIGGRLTSLSVIPTSHINGIAAITLTTLKYNPQTYFVPAGHQDDAIPANHPTRPWVDHKSNGEAAVYVSSEKNTAYFHVSPSMGVQNDDIDGKKLAFNCITSENTARAAMAKDNTPIQPVSFNIEGDEMTVNFKKTVKEFIGSKGTAHGSTEKFYMASLKAPIAEQNWTAEEKKNIEAGKISEVAVNSEYVRLEELLKVPYLANSKTNFALPLTTAFADETQTVGDETFYVHYHDSACVYKSEANELIDYKVKYNEPVDLKKLVTVCVADVNATTNNTGNHANHEDWTKKYADYGLGFRFYLAKADYNTLGGAEDNSNRTNQQKFAKIDSPENGIMTSQVYTIDGNSATAVGREPIVRVELRDLVNNKLIAQRYIKFKWVRETGEKPLTVNYADTLYVCGNYHGYIGTQKMNEDIYDKVKEGGMTKQEFHAIYTDAGFDPRDAEKDGIVRYIKNSEDGVDSYNVVWTLTHKDIVTKYPDWNAQEKLDFTKTFFWKDPTGSYPTLKITLSRTIYKPAFGEFGYDGRYWKKNGQYNIFNVNPIVYGATDFNPAWNERADHKNNPTCNIYTDLLNGFLNKDGKMPMNGAYEHLYYTDKNVAGKKLLYSGNTANYNYNEDGVRFVFDAAKLAAGKNPEGKGYQFPYFNGTKVVMMTATLSPDHTKLYINNELAATIVNAVPNLCDAAENERKDAITYNIKLEEINNPAAEPRTGADPTEAAKALIGQYVPVKLIADICDDDATHAKAHTVTIKDYDAFIIKPLTIGVGTTENFTDATVDGSVISVKGAFTYTCWNADKDGKFYTASNSADATALQKALWEFYECTAGEWMTDQATTNLKVDANGNLVPTAGVTNGPLPNNTTVTYNGADETLKYSNHSGTPVNWDYEIYVPVHFGYKWQTMTETFKVLVKKNAGVPAE